MIHLIIGHRGTGKTGFLKRIATQYPLFTCIDLDEEIEKKTSLTIKQFFSSHSENSFRDLEEETLFTIVKNMRHIQGPVFISIGAGYCRAIPRDCTVLWLQRRSDLNGRIFLDRPRLNPAMSDLDEYFLRFKTREKLYDSIADECFEQPEGFVDINDSENIFLGLTKIELKACLTLEEKRLKNFERAMIYLEKRLNWGLNYFEIRDDLISANSFAWIRKIIPDQKLIYSFRHKEPWSHPDQLANVIWDWPLELGEPSKNVPILSLHERLENEDIKSATKRLNSYKASHYKFAPIVSTWDDLIAGYQWWSEHPQERSFLPRSSDGRWSWFRCFIGTKQKLNFIREGRADVLDQPSLDEWIHGALADNSEFMAVMGSPIQHSYTPVIHRSFSFPHPVYKMNISEQELTKTLLKQLYNLGLRRAAVTSPLKEVAYQLSNSENEIQSVNTMYLKNEKEVLTTNTDLIGFEALMAPYLGANDVIIWGGGGTRKIMSLVLPQAEIYSARTATSLTAHNIENPQVLVWGVGRARQKQCQWPPGKWKPEVIVDLNYTLDSPGREYAKQVGAQYVSGYKMFEIQALKQQEFWSEFCQPFSNIQSD